ncbi:hypothetical protein [Streptomyces sp. NBC_00391]|uniref:hypothetical protein n=1 Tax=Streptomyces sp. NBC_00391 TaxID=2903647 RepID=UPI002E244C87
MPSEDDWRFSEESSEESADESEEDSAEESLELSEDEEESDDASDDASVLLPVPLSLSLPELVSSFVLDDVELVPPALAVVSASACIVPISANMPAAAASVTAAAVAAVRRAPLRIPATAPRSLVVMTVPLRSDVLSRPTVGERSERNL